MGQGFRRALVPLLALLGIAAAAPRALAAESVDLELVLLADASGSIDAGEIRLQREGYAAAMTDREILEVVARGPLGRIAVAYVEWGDVASQQVVVPWTVIDGPAAAQAFAGTLLSAPRLAFGRNAIGSALAFARGLIEGNGIEAPRRVVDLSADSANSWGGPPVARARAGLLAAGITINGLAVLCRWCSGRPVADDLERRFAEEIIGGPASFVVTADGSTSFAEAVRRKLLLEVAGEPPPPRSVAERLRAVAAREAPLP